MQAQYTPPISPKTLLDPAQFSQFRRKNRRWYLLLNLILIAIFVMVAVAINDKTTDLSMIIGGLLCIYCVPLGILVAKNKGNVFLWVILTIISTPFLGFVLSHVLMTRLGFKNEWL